MTEQLTAELVLEGYRIGIFPMADDDGEIYWFSPDPRCIFELDRFHVPHSLRTVLNRAPFDIRVNQAFEQVIRNCAQRAEGTWISDDIRRLYAELHHMGHAHSVETWRDGKLVGGLYGVSVGGAFFGESMFHRATDASKVALVALRDRLVERGFVLLDTQWMTPHLKRFGAVEIPRAEYLGRLASATALTRTFADASRRTPM
ncbi:MAG: leucyl/phenylalanyl-tRNA--protein transferase [Phycisphaerae bacterium]|nr:leucyl/phenylalanyl-tRNA--protein transferase [Phycisphaerae bacterium]